MTPPYELTLFQFVELHSTPPKRAEQDYIATLGILSEVWSTPVYDRSGSKCEELNLANLVRHASASRPQRGAPLLR
jgi:hypothetical protein